MRNRIYTSEKIDVETIGSIEQKRFETNKERFNQVLRPLLAQGFSYPTAVAKAKRIINEQEQESKREHSWLLFKAFYKQETNNLNK
jgi:predicted nucleotidyltransferase